MFANQFSYQPKYIFNPPRDWLGRLRDLLASYPQDDLASTEALCCRIVGDFTAGIVLHRLLYWLPRGCRPDDAIWKSDREWYAELNLTYAQMQRVRARLSPIVKSWVEKARGAPTHHYQLRVEALLTGIATVLNCSIIEVKLALLDKIENGFSRESKMDFRQTRKSSTDQHQSLHQIDSQPESIPDLKIEKPASPPIIEKLIPEETEEKREARQAWDIAYSQMELQLDVQNFDTYLRAARFLNFDGVFHIGVPNQYACDMLQQRLYRDVRRILTDCYRFGQPVDIVFEFVPAEPKREEEELPLFRLLARQAEQEAAATAPPPNTSEKVTTESLLITFGLTPQSARRYGHLDVQAVSALIERVRGKNPRYPIPYLTKSLTRMEEHLRGQKIIKF